MPHSGPARAVLALALPLLAAPAASVRAGELDGQAQPVSQSVAPPAPAALEAPAEPELTGPQARRVKNLQDASLKALRRVYRHRDYRPIWLPREAGLDRARAVIDVLAGAQRHALDPADYDAQPLRRALRQLDLSARAAVDVWLTRAVLAYGQDVTGGRIDHPPLRGGKTAPTGGLEATAFLHRIADSPRPAKVLTDLAPSHAQYRRLAAKRQAYLAVAAAGGWPKISPGKVLAPGMDDPRVAALRQRLALAERLNGGRKRARYGPFGQATAGWSSAATIPGTRYTQKLAERLKRFQARHGLTTDGYLGPDTRRALNVSARQRAREIALNMERWRWLPDELGWRYIKVNIPAYQLSAVYQGRREFRMDVTVGEVKRPTPTFSHHLRYLAVNPDWTIPNSIAVRDILPKQLKDKNYLKDHRIEVYDGWRTSADKVDPHAVDWQRVAEITQNDVENFPYRLRQKPGGTNPLGNVKFMFPNPHAIYLHDTPAEYEFERRQRTFSSGCIRVRHPRQLAAHLLGQATRRSDVKKMIAQAGTEARIKLDHPVPIHIVYHTTWVDESGSLQVRPDVYNRNPALARKLDGRTPRRDPETLPAASAPESDSRQRAEL